MEEYGNDILKWTIDLPEGQDLIFTTIPYDEGWRVYIDGERAEITEVLDSLLAVQSTAGFHEIEFVYRPNCAVYGGLISIIGILVFALLVIWSRSRKARALVKCDNTRTEHFFYCKGDDTTGWLTEASETEAAAAGENPDAEVSEAAAEIPSEPDAPVGQAETSSETKQDGGVSDAEQAPEAGSAVEESAGDMTENTPENGLQ